MLGSGLSLLACEVEEASEAFMGLNPFNLVLKCNQLNVKPASFKMQLDNLLLMIGKETR
jgi:hypothetical protein